MIDIDQIIFELFCRVQIIAAIDLRVTSQARHNLHTAAEVLDFAVKVVINSGAFGARANKAHFAHKDVEQLRQFVQVGQAQDMANAVMRVSFSLVHFASSGAVLCCIERNL